MSKLISSGNHVCSLVLASEMSGIVIYIGNDLKTVRIFEIRKVLSSRKDALRRTEDHENRKLLESSAEKQINRVLAR